MVVDTQYPPFLDALYAKQPGLATSDFDTQRDALLGAAFGSSDHYTRHLRALGHEAVDIIVNAATAQRRWARESGHRGLATLPLSRRSDGLILQQQVREYRPDVLWLLDMGHLTDAAIERLSGQVGVLVGQVACPFDFRRDVSVYDLVISSLPHFVRRFRRLGVRSEYLPLGFEPSVRDRLGMQQARDVELSFVGSMGSAHSAGTELLNAVAGDLPLSLWGPPQPALPEPLASRYRGQAWGMEMYDVLARSQVALNRHIDVAADYANNLRLFEATGMGACLLTDAKRNLSELFVPGEELVTYTDAGDCVRKAKQLLSDVAMREEIAAAGARRTLRDHTYDKRVRSLVEMLADAESRGRRHARRTGSRLRAPARVRSLADRATSVVQERRASREFRVLEGAGAPAMLGAAWKAPVIAGRQRAVAERALRHMYEGAAPAEFSVAAAAVDATALEQPSVLEIGCGSGYYGEVLAHLASGDVDYIGVDYSLPLLRSGRAHDRQLKLVAGDATRLPFADGSFDIALSAAVLMHVAEWRSALAESFRVSRGFVVLHRTPVADAPRTTHLEKRAYGVRVAEHVFARAELDTAVQDLGGSVVRSWLISRSRRPPLDHDVDVVSLLLRRGEP